MSPPPSRQAPKTVYLLPLNDDGSPDVPGNYIYLPHPTTPAWNLRFAIEGASSICRQGSLWVNIPAEGETFDRNRYREYKLTADFNRMIEIDVPVTQAGSFGYYIKYTPLPDFSTDDVPTPEPTQTQIHYIDIMPKLTVQKEVLPLEALSIFSVISKFMGKFPEEWDKHLSGISQRGYNMVHFTPLMTRGDSNSPYSLYDQHQFDRTCFPNGESDAATLVEKMENEYGLLGLTDVVWNHTANNSKWLEEHPEAGYNAVSAPWLESAYELDTALLDYSKRLQSLGLPTTVNSADDINKIMEGVKTHCISGIKLWEYYVMDVERDHKTAIEAWKQGRASSGQIDHGKLGLEGVDQVRDWPLKQKADWIIQRALAGNDRMGERFRRTIKPEVAAGFLDILFGRHESASESDGAAASDTMKSILDEVNLRFFEEYDADAAVIIEQVANRTKYMRLDDHGPKVGPITDENPLIESYFTRLPENETTAKHDKRSLALANNGWVWAADAMKDNAGPFSRAYTRREIIVWQDCVKLRYGSGPEDSPFLWDFMAKYTRLMAKYFTAFRVDNCHSTPIHLAEYMLDQARQVRPNLMIAAELFSGSEEMDYKFVKRLGISCLIREAMQSWSTQEMSRLVHMHGGRPIGSFEVDEISGAEPAQQVNGLTNGNAATKHEVVHRIRQSPVRALFMDCTHDNQVPAQKRDARDTLPNSALVAMCAASIGSVMGYDEIYPELIELVHETRLYTSPSSTGAPIKVHAGHGGIGSIKKLINQIHTLMGKDGYDETYIDLKGEYITVHRVHPDSRKGYFLIAHTAYPGYGNGNAGLGPVRIPGTKARLIGSYMLEVDQSPEAKTPIVNDEHYLKGLPSKTKELSDVAVDINGDDAVIQVPDKFPPGSIALLETWIPAAEHNLGLDKFITSGGKEAFSGLDHTDLNFVLYRHDAEERDSSGGKDGAYTIPKYGALKYCGLEGWWTVLKDIVRNNDLGHPICDHLREGPWALDYIVGRLERISENPSYANLKRPAAWLKERFEVIKKLPSFLLPRYFALVIQAAYNAAFEQGIHLMADNVQHGQKFLKGLSMVSTQVTGYMNDASLWPDKIVPSMAAGLPFFASGWARVWGRDTFIALRGLYLGTGRYDDAKEHILAFGSVLKHGMIPNLLNAGNLPRYNSRDSIWFYTQNCQDYVNIVPDGINILQEKVKRRFLPYDDTWFPSEDSRAYSKTSTIEDIIQEAMQRHASGLSFREYNAGPELDRQMKPEGFDIEIHTDWETGIIYGGSQFNCGTWMDKMGESEKAGSKGVPGTPRDGAAVEITGLLYSTVKWLADLNTKGKFKYSGVSTSSDPSDTSNTITYADWAAKIKANFERCYYVPLDAAEDSQYNVNTPIVNRRGIYKDLYRSGKEYEDYQLRPNFPIAMTVAPDLFDPKHALKALEIADHVIRGPCGMRTLDPSDLNYRPYYINSEDSTDFHTSKGRNYHQGPEWLWPTGFFLRALLKFDLMRRKTPEEKVESFQQVTRRLKGCVDHLRNSPWAGLTELTQKDGEFCGDSSPTQAWSAGCLIDLYYDAAEYGIE
ncbi:MAG: hypothetical protein M1820_000269 [Bogoriella megaspora]|nr:MAG: hypothetical protein M1820_000269 [Bogoriella megaspora]